MTINVSSSYIVDGYDDDDDDDDDCSGGSRLIVRYCTFTTNWQAKGIVKFRMGLMRICY